MYVQECLKDIMGLIPGHCNKASMAIKPVVIFVGRVSCLHFVKYTIFVKHNKVKCNKTKYVHIGKIIVMYRVWHYPWFEASVGSLGTYSPWMKGITVLSVLP